MARRRGLVSTLSKIARDAAKAQRNAERAQIARQREFERQQRLIVQNEQRQLREAELHIKRSIKEQKAFEREQKVLYIEGRKEETADLNSDVEYILDEFENILNHTLRVNDTISFDDLYHTEKFPPFKMPHLKEVPVLSEATLLENFLNSDQPQLLEKLFGFGRKERIQKAEDAYQSALNKYNLSVTLIQEITADNDSVLQSSKQKYESEKQLFEDSVSQANLQIDNFKTKYYYHEKDAVESYCTMVLEQSNYISVFPQEFELIYIVESKELIVEYELPAITCFPDYKEYKYIQSKDEIRGTEFKVKDKHEIYSKLIASVTLRTIHEIFEADQGEHIDSIAFNGIVNTVDASTGLEIQPCIITLHTKKEEFTRFDLSKVDVISCIKGLKAHVSPSMAELSPVKPIVNLDMFDKRFIDEKDLISGIDDRTNLLEMNPFDFEHLVCNLFSKIGLESKVTRSSRDGGVDVVAFDPRPVFGGKYIIQAKRYRNTVEVAAVRDLYGTMMNENASKGILVTTSTFGPDARSFSKDKPIELIDGTNLLYMLEEQGIRAKIAIPS